VSAVTVSGIFSDSRSAYIVSFFLTLWRCFKNDTTSANFRSVWKNDLMSVVVLKNDLMSGRQCVVLYWLYVGIEKWHNVGPTLCHFFCSKFDRRCVIFYLSLKNDFLSDQPCVISVFYKGKFTQISAIFLLFFELRKID
jgi:hypothetical protein